MKSVALSVVMSALSLGAIAEAQEDRATIQLRDGTRVEGRIEELDRGTLFLRVSQDDQRRLPVGDIALIDRAGGASGLPETELREARGADHLLLLTGGSSVKGRLQSIVGGQGSGVSGARTYVFRTTEGQDRSFTQREVSRIYLGTYPFEAVGSTAGIADLVSTPVPAGGVRVAAAAGWVSSGLSVKKGDWVSFSSSGEVQLSDNRSDRARPAGSARLAPLSPLPSVSAGALIGRIGSGGQAFGIGDQTRVPMPEAGMLYFTVNDGERSDNTGEFVVVATLNGSR